MLAWEFDDYSMSENLFLYSEQYDQSSWINQNSFETINAITSPDGLITAEKLIGNNGQTGRQSIYQTVSVISGTTYTFSVFLKQAERRYATIWFDNVSITEGAYYGSNAYIDLQTGTIANGSTQTKIVAYPNGWYRCYVTATPSFTGSLNLNTSIGTSNNAADGAGTIAYQYTGDGVSGFYISKGQFERGTLTDYTPTTTTAISRVLPATTNTNITGLGTYYSSGFDENVGFTTFLSANIFPPYDLIYDEFGGTFFGAGQGRYKRQNTDKSVIVYNEIDEVSDFRDIVRTGLILDLDAGMNSSFNNTGGTTWTDLSGSGNNGTLVNTPTYNTSGYFTFSYLSTQSVSFNSSSSLQFLNRLPYTLEAWVYPTRNPGANNWTGIFDRESDAGSGRDGYNLYFLGSAGTDTYFFTERFTSGSYNPVSVTLNQSITVNNWHHVVGTYDGNTLTLYRNGSSVGTPVATTGNITNSSKTLTLGVRGGQYFDGRISNAKTYNRALSAAEILQNYNALKHRFGL
jgi:hypothetical protein